MDWLESFGYLTGRPPDCCEAPIVIRAPLTPPSPRLVKYHKQRQILARDRKEKQKKLLEEKRREEERKRKIKRKSEITIVYKKRDYMNNNGIVSGSDYLIEDDAECLLADSSGDEVSLTSKRSKVEGGFIEKPDINNKRLLDKSRVTNNVVTNGKRHRGTISDVNIINALRKRPAVTGGGVGGGSSLLGKGPCRIDISDVMRRRQMRMKGKDVFYIDGQLAGEKTGLVYQKQDAKNRKKGTDRHPKSLVLRNSNTTGIKGSKATDHAAMIKNSPSTPELKKRTIFYPSDDSLDVRNSSEIREVREEKHASSIRKASNNSKGILKIPHLHSIKEEDQSRVRTIATLSNLQNKVLFNQKRISRAALPCGNSGSMEADATEAVRNLKANDQEEANMSINLENDFERSCKKQSENDKNNNFKYFHSKKPSLCVPSATSLPLNKPSQPKNSLLNSNIPKISSSRYAAFNRWCDYKTKKVHFLMGKGKVEVNETDGNEYLIVNDIPGKNAQKSVLVVGKPKEQPNIVFSNTKRKEDTSFEPSKRKKEQSIVSVNSDACSPNDDSHEGKFFDKIELNIRGPVTYCKNVNSALDLTHSSADSSKSYRKTPHIARKKYSDLDSKAKMNYFHNLTIDELLESSQYISKDADDMDLPTATNSGNLCDAENNNYYKGKCPMLRKSPSFSDISHKNVKSHSSSQVHYHKPSKMSNKYKIITTKPNLPATLEEDTMPSTSPRGKQGWFSKNFSPRKETSPRKINFILKNKMQVMNMSKKLAVKNSPSKTLHKNCTELYNKPGSDNRISRNSIFQRTNVSAFVNKFEKTIRNNSTQKTNVNAFVDKIEKTLTKNRAIQMPRPKSHYSKGLRFSISGRGRHKPTSPGSKETTSSRPRSGNNVVNYDYKQDSMSSPSVVITFTPADNVTTKVRQYQMNDRRLRPCFSNHLKPAWLV